MSVVAIPNVSEGRSGSVIDACSRSVIEAGARVLDVHRDAVHNRSVLTTYGDPRSVSNAMVALVEKAQSVIDLRMHEGVHPRLGVVDVCPFVTFDVGADPPVDLARTTGAEIARTGVPVYLYGAAALRAETVDLPDLRRGGLEELMRRALAGLPPDFGPPNIDGRTGVVCVGARGPLIAFNVVIEAPVATARAIAAGVRSAGGGSAGVRALGFPVTGERSQVSMNLTDPDRTGIDDAFAAVARLAAERDARVLATEIVGLVPERFLPTPDAEAARLLIEPGRSLEAVVAG